jgi:RNase P subunit RPR2
MKSMVSPGSADARNVIRPGRSGKTWASSMPLPREALRGICPRCSRRIWTRAGFDGSLLDLEAELWCLCGWSQAVPIQEKEDEIFG